MLTTDDYQLLGKLIRTAAQSCGGGYFGILEGGYNHEVLGHNVAALFEGMQG